MTAMDDARLLSPQRRRIYPNPQTGSHMRTAGPLVKQQRRGLEVGQPDQVTWDALLRLGWTEYRGPAMTDERGYIVSDTPGGVS